MTVFDNGDEGINVEYETVVWDWEHLRFCYEYRVRGERSRYGICAKSTVVTAGEVVGNILDNPELLKEVGEVW